MILLIIKLFMGLILSFVGIKLLSSSMKDEYIKKFKVIIDKLK